MAPSPLSPDGKAAPRRSPFILPLLLLTAVIVLACIGLAVYVFAGATKPTNEHLEPVDIGPIMTRPPPTRTTTTATTAPSSTTEGPDDSKEKEPAPFNQPSSTLPPSTPPTTDVDDFTVEAVSEPTPTSTTTTTANAEEEALAEAAEETREAEASAVEACAAIPIQRTSCGSLPRRRVPSSTSHGLTLLEYGLNMSVSYHGEVRGDVEMFLQPGDAVDQIALAASKDVAGLHSDVTVVDCGTGEVICASVEQDTTSKIVAVNLATPSSSLLRLIFRGFHSRSSARDAVYSQSSSSQPLAVGSHFSSEDHVKNILPILPGSRAPLSLCISHDERDSVASNAPIDGEATHRARRDADKRTTCFQRTPALPPHQYAFLIHQRTESVFFKPDAGSSLPEMEVVATSTKDFSEADYAWIKKDVGEVISTLSSWTEFPYPLDKLTIVAAPISPIGARGKAPLGMVVLPRTLKNSHDIPMRRSLLNQLISQWMGGAVGAEDCFEESLQTYLEWRLIDDLKFIHDNKSVEKKVSEGRPSSLSPDTHKRGRPLRFQQRLNSASCPDRMPSIFYSIDATYGKDTIAKLLALVLRRRPFTNVSTSTWASSLEEVTGSEAAGSYLSDWFSRPSRPLLSVSTSDSGRVLNIEQIAAPNKDLFLWRLPIEVGSTRNTTTVELSPQEKQTVSIDTDDYAIVDPKRKSTALVLYDLDSYIRVQQCWQNSRCPSTHEQLQAVYADFGAFYMADLVKVDVHDKGRLRAWKTFLEHIHRNGGLPKEASCCVGHALNMPYVDRDCIFLYREVCSAIELNKAVRTP